MNDLTPVRIAPLYWLLLAAPLAVALQIAQADPLWIFLSSGLAIIPLAGLMGRATESLAESMGETVGGLLNASFGNAAELIIAFIALSNNKLELVKASITGSILGNVLLVLGVAILVGGFYHPRQIFNRTAASLGATLLALASIGLIIPSIYHVLAHQVIPPGEEKEHMEHLSEEIAVILAVAYLLSLLFTLHTHQHLFAGAGAKAPPEWRVRTALFVLLLATAAVAVMSEFLVSSVDAAARALGMSEVFVGVIVVAIIGNAAEHSTAVIMAAKNKMDLAVTIAIGSSLQIALFVAPVLVFSSLLIGHPLDLHFTAMEVIAIIIAIAVLSLIAIDGETHWMEGALLLAVYAILALAFYHLPQAHG